MTDRAPARHRATARAATPLSSLSSAVSEHVGTIGRSGVVIAMSSGLVATMGLPAQAVTKAEPVTASLDATALAATLTLDAAFLAAPQGPAPGAAVTAPAAAKVAFDTSGFTAQKAAPRPAPAPRAAATPTSSRSSERASRTSTRVTLPSSSAGSGVLAIAARYFGIPYRWGGSTTAGFDCSGYTVYVFDKVGISLPRTANAQMLASRRISRSEARPGDLVFFTSGGRAYHVGIYAGGNWMYDSPRSGKTTGKHKIWSSSVVFGRF